MSPLARCFTPLALILFLMFGNSAMSTAVTPPLHWNDVHTTPIQILGLPFLGINNGHWWRFPEDAAAKIPDYVWETAKCTSGARIRLRTDAREVWLRGDLADVMSHPNTSRYGAAAFDLYVDGEYLSSMVPEASGPFELRLMAAHAAAWRELTIYLPLFSQSSVSAIGLNPEARLDTPTSFSQPGPVVFYGTSITHGGCAGRSGLSYPAQLCRSLNLDFVNFGMNGCGRGELEVARILARVPHPAAYVLDYAQNNTSTASLAANYEPFINELHAAHPEVPILCTTPIYWTAERPGTESGSIHAGMRAVIRAAVQNRRDSGDRHIEVVEGWSLIGPAQGDGLADGLHPNAIGFQYMAHGLAPVLANALGLTMPE